MYEWDFSIVYAYVCMCLPCVSAFARVCLRLCTVLNYYSIVSMCLCGTTATNVIQLRANDCDGNIVYNVVFNTVHNFVVIAMLLLLFVCVCVCCCSAFAVAPSLVSVLRRFCSFSIVCFSFHSVCDV